MKATETHLELSHRDIFLILLGLAMAGLVLAFFGLRAAFDIVGTDSREGHIIMAAAGIMGLMGAIAIGIGHTITRRSLTPTQKETSR